MDHTDHIIQQALKLEQQEKEARKAAKEKDAGKARQDKADRDRLDEAERKKATVREDEIDKAKGQRALKRKEREAGMEAVEDEGAEEELQVERDEKEGEFTAFNLKEEREAGYFDENGFYVENKKKDEEEEADAWLTSEAGQVVSAEVLKRIQERQRREAEAEGRQKEMSQAEMAAVRGEMAGLMQEGETVARALKRLGGKSKPQPRGKLAKRARGGEEEQGVGSREEEAREEGERRAQFNRLTELADLLTGAGETDIYGETKEELHRAAELFGGRGRGGAGAVPRTIVPGAPAGPSLTAAGTKGAVGGATEKEGSSEEDDMFADSDDEEVKARRKAREERKKAKEAQAAAPQPTAGTAPAAATPAPQSAAATAAPAADEEEVDYSTWPIRELQRFVQERGEDPRKFAEKADLIAKVRELARQGPEGDSGAMVAPPGYVFNPQTGMFFNAETRMHYDAKSGYYSQGGKWFYWDGGQFVEYRG